MKEKIKEAYFSNRTSYQFATEQSAKEAYELAKNICERYFFMEGIVELDCYIVRVPNWFPFNTWLLPKFRMCAGLCDFGNCHAYRAALLIHSIINCFVGAVGASGCICRPRPRIAIVGNKVVDNEKLYEQCSP